MLKTTDVNSPFERNEVRLFFISFAVALLAKGAILMPISYGVDDYQWINYAGDHGHFYGFFLEIGRFGWIPIMELLSLVGASPPATNIVFVIMAFSILAVTGILTCRLFGISHDLFLSAVVASLIIAHPYQIETFTAKYTIILVAAYFLLCLCALYFSRMTAGSLVVTSLCFMYAVSIYQLAVNMALVILLFTVILETVRRFTAGYPLDIREISRTTRLLPRLITISSGTILYYLIMKIILFIVDVPLSGRGRLVQLDHVPERMGQIKSVLISVFISPEPLAPASLKIILASVFAIMLYMLARIVIRRGAARSEVGAACLIICMIGAAALSIAGVLLVLDEWKPMERELFAAGIFWAGTVSVAYLLTADRWRTAVGLLTIIVLFGFVGINNRVYSDQLRVNMRDILRANRLVANLEKEPGFEQVRRIAFMHTGRNPVSPVSTAYGDLNRSAFQITWAQVMILNEITGYDFIEATDQEKYYAFYLCSNEARVPVVKVMGDLGIICE